MLLIHSPRRLFSFCFQFSSKWSYTAWSAIPWWWVSRSEYAFVELQEDLMLWLSLWGRSGEGARISVDSLLTRKSWSGLEWSEAKLATTLAWRFAASNSNGNGHAANDPVMTSFFLLLLDCLFASIAFQIWCWYSKAEPEKNWTMIGYCICWIMIMQRQAGRSGCTNFQLNINAISSHKWNSLAWWIQCLWSCLDCHSSFLYTQRVS